MMRRTARVAGLAAALGATLGATLIWALVLGTGGVALAQEGEGPSPQEIEAKIREIEKLMKKAEQSLARSTNARRTKENTAEAAKRLEDLLEQKAQEQTGKSAGTLRKEAEQGSAEAAEALRELTDEARAETADAASKMERLLDGSGGSSRAASEGVRKLLEETKRSGKQAGEGIQWLLDNAVTGSGSGGGGGQPQKPQGPGENEDDPKDGAKKPGDDPQPASKKPQHELDPPRPPEFEVWLAELPPQVRRAYESKDWDAIPAKWRGLLRDWTKKMADELESGR